MYIEHDSGWSINWRVVNPPSVYCKDWLSMRQQGLCLQTAFEWKNDIRFLMKQSKLPWEWSDEARSSSTEGLKHFTRHAAQHIMNLLILSARKHLFPIFRDVLKTSGHNPDIIKARDQQAAWGIPDCRRVSGPDVVTRPLPVHREMTGPRPRHGIHIYTMTLW